MPTSTDLLPVLVLSTGLREGSHSRILAQRCQEELDKLDCEVRWIDLAERELPFCDAGSCYEHPHAVEVKGAIEWASAIVIATPIYNFNLCGQAKAVIELAGKAFTGKVVGFLCAAGGQTSYMSIMGIANSLMRHCGVHRFGGRQVRRPIARRRMDHQQRCVQHCGTTHRAVRCSGIDP